MKKTSIKSLAFLSLMAVLMAFSSPSSTSIKATSTQPKDNTNDLSVCTTQNSVFQDGEKITYKLFYNWKFVWVAAGEVTFRVKELENQYHLSAVGRTYKSYDPFFKVRDTYECYVDKKTLLPMVSIRDVKEGKYRLYDEVTFDRNRKVAKSLRGKSKDVATVTEYPIDQCIHDILSIIYFARNVDFDNMDAGEQIPINLFMDKETWPLKVTFKGRQEKKRIKGNGKFKTLQFSPQVIAGEYFMDGTEMNVWVSDDKNHLPLIIESPLTVGSVKAVLKKHEGLKYDLEADLKNNK